MNAFNWGCQMWSPWRASHQWWSISRNDSWQCPLATFYLLYKIYKTLTVCICWFLVRIHLCHLFCVFVCWRFFWMKNIRSIKGGYCNKETWQHELHKLCDSIIMYILMVYYMVREGFLWWITFSNVDCLFHSWRASSLPFPALDGALLHFMEHYSQP